MTVQRKRCAVVFHDEVAVLVGGLVLTVLVSTGGAVPGAVAVGKTPQLAFLFAATLHSVNALVTFASLATLLSVLVPDRMKAMLFSGGMITVLSVVGQFKPLRWLNPLALFGSSALIQHPYRSLCPFPLAWL
jgi:hypothetical protein